MKFWNFFGMASNNAKSSICQLAKAKMIGNENCCKPCIIIVVVLDFLRALIYNSSDMLLRYLYIFHLHFDI